MSSYPKWLYHPTKEAVVVPDEAAHKALGHEWVESPAHVKPAETKKPEAPEQERHPVVEHHKKLK